QYLSPSELHTSWDVRHINGINYISLTHNDRCPK
ncbi:hypothetical protein DBR06_SOUSAS30310039, partial [Sousa chinensis]